MYLIAHNTFLDYARTFVCACLQNKQSLSDATFLALYMRRGKRTQHFKKLHESNVQRERFEVVLRNAM